MADVNIFSNAVTRGMGIASGFPAERDYVGMLGGVVLKGAKDAIDVRQKQADAEAKQAQNEATLKQSAALGAFDKAMTLINNPDFPSASKVAIYNGAMRGALRNLGYEMPALPEGTEWNRDFTGYAKGFGAILSDPSTTYQEKQELVMPLFAQMSRDPRLAPVIKDWQDQLAARRQQEVSGFANTYYRVFTGQASEEEATQLAAQQAIASAPDRPGDLPSVRQARQERALILAEAQRAALTQRDGDLKRQGEMGVTVGKDQRRFERDPVTGQLREVVAAAPEGPSLSQPLKDKLSEFGVDVKALDPTKPNDAAIITRARREIETDARTKAVKDAEAQIPVEVKKKKALEGVKSQEVSQQALNAMQGHFTSGSKTFVDVRDAYGRVLASAKEPSAAGDLSLIFNYMKILDPGSVVRESEFQVAAQAGGYGERIQSLVQRAMNGQRLADSVRKDFVDRAEKLFDAQLGSQAKLEDEFRRLAKERGIEPSTVIVDYVGDYRKKGGARNTHAADDPLGIRR